VTHRTPSLRRRGPRTRKNGRPGPDRGHGSRSPAPRACDPGTRARSPGGAHRGCRAEWETGPTRGRGSGVGAGRGRRLPATPSWRRAAREPLHGNGTLKTEPIDGPKGLGRDQLARDESVEGSELLERPRFAQDDAKKGGGVDVGDHLDARSCRRAARLSVDLARGRSVRRSLGLRVARRISRGLSASYGTIRATGVPLSTIVIVRPPLTLRRCSLRCAFRTQLASESRT
jgi:hypothetical protein